jgi:hypothetical protein
VPAGEPGLVLENFTCPACRGQVVALLRGHVQRWVSGVAEMTDDTERWVAYPRPYTRPIPPQVDASLADDYNDAAAILGLSPKASAALARRCLQNTIREAAHITRHNLSDEIDELVDSGLVSSSLGAELHAVRNVGNFAAHPMKNTSTGAIIDVEPGEAEWTLDLLDRLFDELIVGPAVSASRKSALNAKLRAAGKPEITLIPE